MSTGRNYNRIPPTTSVENVENQNSEQIQRRIDRTRGAMDETIDAIGERLNPRRLVDQVIDSFSGSGAKSAASGIGDVATDFVEQLGKQVRRNPTATLLVGAGLAWMALGNRNDEVDECDLHDMRDVDYGAASHDASDGQSKIAQAGSTATNKVSDAASSTKHGLENAAGATKSAISSAGRSTARVAQQGYESSRGAANSAYRSAAAGGKSLGRSTRRAYRSGANSVSDAYNETAERFQDAHEDYPLAVGAGFLALGALAGLALPRTRREDRWMGDASDQVVDDVWQAGEEAIDRGKEVVDETLNTARESADEHGLSGESLVERASNVVQEATASAKQAAKNEGLTPNQLKGDVEEVAQDTKQAAKESGGKATNKANG